MRLTANSAYSAKSAFEAFFFGKEMAPCVKDPLWAADRLERCGLHHPPVCPLCCHEPETDSHLLVQCVSAREVWYSVLLPYRLH